MKKTLKFLLSLCLMPSLFSCSNNNPSTSTSPNDSTSSSSQGGSKNLTELDIYFQEGTVDPNQNNCIWLWNSDGSYLFKDVFAEETSKIGDLNFYKATIEFTSYNLQSEWDKPEVTIDINIEDLTFFDNGGFLLRSVDGTSQTANFSYNTSEITDEGSIYYINTSNGFQTYYKKDKIPVKPTIPDDIDSYTFYFLSENDKYFDVMSHVYFFNYEANDTIVIKPDWQYSNLEIENKDGKKTYNLKSFTIDFNTSYVGNAGWNFTGKETIKITKEHLTGGIVLRNQAGDYKSSDIIIDFDKVNRDGNDKFSIFYSLPDDYNFISEYEKKFQPGDMFYNLSDIIAAA